MADTVTNALNTPDQEQPYAALGVTDEEYARIREILGRRPTDAELAMYSVMWSEHCSYKSSKIHLRRFSELPQETPRGPLLAGIGENAGVVDIGQGWAVTFKAESHNSPSYLEPYQGAATGVGGIARDILAMGARPIGVMDSLRLGPVDAKDTLRVLPRAVAGISDYAGTLGVPNIGGELQFHDSYLANPLVNAMCVGVLRHEDLHLAHASGVGNKVIMYGAATGGDGIGGASLVASGSFAEDGAEDAPNVQAGDPFMEKLIIEATLEMFSEGLIQGIQDFGAAGISCATSELASAGDGGMHVELSQVPLRDPDLLPEEILMSESQERMMAVVEPGDVGRFMRICAKWGVEAAVVGEVTEGDRLVIDWRGETIVDVDPRTVAHEGPVYDRPYHRPGWLDEVNANRAEDLHRDNSADGLRSVLLRVMSHPDIADKSWVTDQYDRLVRGNSVLAQPEDAGMLRIDEGSGLGIAMSMDANPRFTFLNPYLGAQQSLAEAYRNVAVTGAEPIAVTDCLNFGSPEDPEVMWSFVEAILGLVDACKELDIPVTGGNVSLYNQTSTGPILPTPTIGVLGVIDDVAKRVRSGFVHSGDTIVLLGHTREELSGSIWADVVHDGHLGGTPPAVALADEQRLARVIGAAAAEGLLTSAHDLSDGGLAVALVESALLGDIGFAVTLPEGDQTVSLFSESAGRAVVSLAGHDLERFEELCREHGLGAVRLGEVIDNGDCEFVGDFTVPLSEIRDAWTRTIPAVMG